jgi:2-polyprenyl-6-hydroxyphenyl methylase/3-demethylubiquinone-9 3-methyltransferase
VLRAHDVVEYHCPDPEDFYSQMYRKRLESLLRLAWQVMPAGRVLDLGCAQGNAGLLLAEQGWDVVAVDLRVEFLQYARMKYERGAHVCLAANAAELPFVAACFDLVLWGEMIEHVAFPEQILAEIFRVLRRDGYLLLSTPNGGRWRTGLPTFSTVGDRSELVARQFLPDSDGHLFLFTRGELVSVLRQNRFEVLRHCFYASPWICGRLGARHLVKWIPARRRETLDAWTLQWPGLAERVAEGQIVVAQRR